MGLFDMTDGSITPVRPTRFGANDEARRSHIRTALRENIAVLGEDLLIIAEDFDGRDAVGAIDMLCVDRAAHLVVVELCRSGLSDGIEPRALGLAATAAGMSFDGVASHLATQLTVEGAGHGDARQILSEWFADVGGSQAEIGRDVRLILVYGDFAPEAVTTTAWLREVFGIDIRCVRITPYRIGEKILLEVQQVAPLPASEPPPGRRLTHATVRRRRVRPTVVAAVTLLVVVVLSLVLRTYVTSAFEVPSGSMTPTLQIGDRLFVNKVFSTIHRGDVIVFSRAPGDSDTSYVDLVKRVVGLPGETISSVGPTILINGHPISEPWLPALAGVCIQPTAAVRPTTIQPGQYFVMGDCRGNSSDSRAWGTVPATNIIGKVVLVGWRHNHPWLHWF